MSGIRQNIERRWYDRPGWLFLLVPVMWLFAFISKRRKIRLLAKRAVTDSTHAPVCVVGNISVGGTGKTPLIIFLIKLLQGKGHNVGVVTRGYGANQKLSVPVKVTSSSTASDVGDEPLLIYQRTQCVVFACADRLKACEAMTQRENVDIILSDDGMQHYAMGRNIELAVMDGVRLIGNGYLLPVGPLREPAKRLKDVDWLLVNGQTSNALYDYTKKYKWPRAIYFSMQPIAFVNIKTGQKKPLDYFYSVEKLIAVAGIGHPERFFITLDKLGYKKVESHAFADHHQFQSSDFDAFTKQVVLMTEKDAVKCQDFADENLWFLSIDIALDSQFQKEFLARVQHLVDDSRVQIS